MLRALVHPADIPDRDGGRMLLEHDGGVVQRFPRIEHLWVDVDIGYRGRFVRSVEEALNWTVEVSRH